jgi:serine/threonine-protein kinase
MGTDSGDDVITQDATTHPDPAMAPTGVAGGGGGDPASLTGLARSTRYEVGAPLGTGGMGEVLSARDTHLGREVAVKRLRSGAPTADDIGRFLREARIQGRLDHPAIVPIHDLAIDDRGRPFFSMKQLAGVTLHQILGGEPGDSAVQWSRPKLLRAFVDVCLAVEFAHTRGVIHRDLKPGNIVLGDFGEVYVLDWGVARVRGDAPDAVRRGPAPAPNPIAAGLGPSTPVPTGAVTLDAGATAAGAILGTPGYMAPEQLRGEADITPGADIYALGCILFEILAGESFHPRGTAALASTLAGPDPRPSLRVPGADISPELDAICARATAPEAGQRFGSARALAEAVQGYLDGDRDIALRRQLAARHLEEARDALDATTDDERRRRVMRAAGRALALDPASTEAANLITKLLLAPPPATPKEVERDLARADAAQARRHARFSLIAFAAYLSFMPVFLWIGVASWSYFALAYGVAIAAATWAVMTRRLDDPPPYRAWVAVAFNALFIAIIGRMLGPWLVGPGLAVVAVAIFSTHPHLRSTWLVSGIYTVAVLAPWGLELLGVLSRSSWGDATGFHMTSPALHIDPVRGQVGVFLFIVGILAVAGLMSRWVARMFRESQERFALQAWQLEQLVPEITHGAASAATR